MNKCLRIVFCTVIASIIVILSSVSYAASGLDDTVQPANGYGPTHQTIVGNKNGEDPANCYAFALGAKNAINIGDSYGSFYSFNKIRDHYIDIKTAAQYVKHDLEYLQADCKILTGKDNNPNYKTKKDEHLIALRVTPKTDYKEGTTDTYDYHFMRRFVDENGNYYWRHKPGRTGKIYQLDKGYNPDNVRWSKLSGGKEEVANYYTSEIVYIVVPDKIDINNSTFKTVDGNSVYLNSIDDNGVTKKVTSKNIKLGLKSVYAIKPKFDPDNASYQTIDWPQTKKVKTVLSFKENRITPNSVGKVIGIEGYINKFGHSDFDGSKLTINVEVGNYYTGDANNDGRVDMKDVNLIQRYICGYASEISNMAAADANNDGGINVMDVIVIQRYIAGLIDCFPVE
ncbi:MAG: dockerin type I repeat-containing protein [Ruminococcus sp.]|nr:dockerin type I repeat-containing protein [Ruminococcus sp.]